MSSLIDTDTTATPTPTDPPETRDMGWGGTVPSAAPVAWGARAIYKIGSVEVRFTKAGKRLKRPREVTEATIDILWDRQSWHGEPAACKALSTWLNKKALPALRRECVARYITGDSDERVTVEGDGYTLSASPRESYGYLYITAWKNETASACACGKCKPECLANRGAVSGRCTCCGVLVCEQTEAK